jgi:hypothetical protein
MEGAFCCREGRFIGFYLLEWFRCGRYIYLPQKAHIEQHVFESEAAVLNEA